ncbi:hypothetical protein VPHD292_0039 [Vibrio phage D292]
MRLSQPNYTSNVLKLNDSGSPTPWQLAAMSNSRKKVVNHRFVKSTRRICLT